MADFAKNTGQVAGVLQRCHNVRNIFSGFHKPHRTRTMAVTSRGNDRSTWRANGRIDVGAIELHRGRGEGIQLRRQIDWSAAVDAQ